MEKSIMAKMPEGKEFELIEPGNYVARCYSMIQLGTHVSEYAGKETRRERVRITWELPTELREDGKPFVVGEEFTLSMSDMGNLRPMLESWRGRAFTEEESQAFDITKVLSIPCLINVIHKKSKDGKKTFAVIQSVSPLPKGMECPPQVNETMIFTVDDFNSSELENLPDFIKNKIKESVEYNGENQIVEVDENVDHWAGTTIDKLGFNKNN